ncbi:MAG: hypothetical protein WA317_01460 [Mycobacterium sp.]|uniref:hypothetical protein n=1 Tax=Mycobacterium sp. TaxID=1785 RepID=UPI003CC5F4AB
MTTVNFTTTTPRRNRVSIELPIDLVERVNGFAEMNGIDASELWFHWLVTAGRMVCQGHGHRLPQVPLQGSVRRLPPGTLGKVKVVRFYLGKQVVARIVALFEAAGTSAPAVLMEAARALDAAEGDLFRMEWPPVEVSTPH